MIVEILSRPRTITTKGDNMSLLRGTRKDWAKLEKALSEAKAESLIDKNRAIIVVKREDDTYDTHNCYNAEIAFNRVSIVAIYHNGQNIT